MTEPRWESTRGSLRLEITGPATWSMTSYEVAPDWSRDMLVTARRVSGLDHPAIAELTTSAMSPEGDLTATGRWGDGARADEAAPSSMQGWIRVAATLADAAAAIDGVDARCGAISPRQIVYGERPVILGLGVTAIAEKHDQGLRGAAMTIRHFRMSPEEMLRRPVDTRTDAFHVAYFLFERVAGLEPYPASNPFDYLKALGDNAYRDPRAHVGGPLAGILARCFQRIENRPTARWLADELARL